MRPRDVTIFALFPVVFLSLTAGCTTTRTHHSGQYPDAPSGEVFLRPAPAFESSSFSARWSGVQSENDKIRYLLDRVSNSNLRFIRNGSAYNGQEARQWLLFKMSRWSEEAKTAQDFVKNLSYSKQSGKPYLVEFPDRRRYTLQSVLKNELLAFENFLTVGRTIGPSPNPLPPRSPVSVAFMQAAATATPPSNASS